MQGPPMSVKYRGIAQYESPLVFEAKTGWHPKHAYYKNHMEPRIRFGICNLVNACCLPGNSFVRGSIRVTITSCCIYICLV